MRLLATAFVLVIGFAPTAVHGEAFDWPGYGTVSVAVPAGWSVRPQSTNKERFYLIAKPQAAPVASAQFSLIISPPEQPLRVEQVKGRLEDMTRQSLDQSVEKAFDPKPLTLSRGSGWVVQLTDASLLGKPAEPGKYKVMRSALALLDDQVTLVATILFDDPSLPEVGTAMSLLSSLRFERGTTDGQVSYTSGGPFTFTVPQSQVVVKVSDPSLRLDDAASAGRNYFKLARSDPQLILSGWLEPASSYKGLEEFWQAESRSPAYAGALAPTRVEMLRNGPWEVVAFDVPVPGGGTSVHVRAERVQAGTWIDLHLSTTSAKSPTELRAELLAALRHVQVVEK
jgi:uncharacterized protein YbdZ (MbtH family)